MASCSNKFIPPDVKKIPKEIKTHDHVRTDNYYWMRLTDEQKSAKKYRKLLQKVLNMGTKGGAHFSRAPLGVHFSLFFVQFPSIFVDFRADF